MKVKLIGHFVLVLFFISICSCNGAEKPVKETTSNNQQPTTNNKQQKQVIEKSLKSLNQNGDIKFGVYIYNRTLKEYRGNETELVENCSKIGITEVYLSFSSNRFNNDKTYSKLLQKIIKLFHQKNIKVYALTLDSPILIFQTDKAVKLVGQVKKFNQSATADAKFDGISADLEPHMLKKNRAKKWGETELYWSSKGYGKGKDNDKLIVKTLETFKMISKEAGDIPISEAVGTFYFNRQQKGELSQADPDAFLNSGCQYIIIMSYFNTAEKVIRKSLLGLNETQQENSIMVAVKTSINTSGGEGRKTTFEGKTWSEFYKDLSLISSELNKKPAFRGIAFFEYEGLEKIWLNK